MTSSSQTSQDKASHSKSDEKPKINPKKSTRKEPIYRQNRRRFRRPMDRRGKTQSWDGGDKIGKSNDVLFIDHDMLLIHDIVQIFVQLAIYCKTENNMG